MRIFKIHRIKSEAPLIAVFFIFSIFLSLYLYPKVLWFGFLVFPFMAMSYMILRVLNLGLFKKQCFIILDEEGIRYCFHLFQQARLLKWEQIEKVNFQMYEVNFRLKVSGEVISMQTTYLEKASEYQELKNIITEKCELM